MQPGTRLGGYEIVSALGAGGMGEVYRARDTKLGRDVALKILPTAFTNDPDRVARFKREAQVLASLNHPNIGAIYGFEESGALAVPRPRARRRRDAGRASRARGQAASRSTTRSRSRDRSRRRSKPRTRRASSTAISKPSNIALTADDQVKVLDFGLAKAFDTSSSIDGAPDVDALADADVPRRRWPA